MVQDRSRSLLTTVLVAIAAGTAGALLFFLAARGTWAGLVLSYFAPLPLMIGTIGFGLAAGGGAILCGALVAGLIGTPVVGLAVGAGLLLPAYLVCVAALRAPGVQPDDRRVSRVILVSMVFAAATTLAVLISLVAEHGSATGARTAVVNALLPRLRPLLQDSQFPATITAEELAHAIIAVAPAIIAASSFFMLVINTYIAGRVAFISGQLANPWPLIPDTLMLPGVAAGLFALACGLVFLGGSAGVVASVVASALGCGFALEGLAVVHALTRRFSARTALLIAMYALIICLPPWPLVLLALAGFVDAAFHLRRRHADAPSSKPKT